MKKLLFIPVLLLSLFLEAQDWQTDLGTAKALAAKEDKTIILVFQGSDWCAPCMKLEREIWTSDTFKAYAKDHYVMIKADFPRKRGNALSKEQQERNNQLAEQYNKNGYFPFVVVMDKDGHVLGETGYKNMTPEEYIKHLESFKP